jgi:hypothetical protein
MSVLSAIITNVETRMTTRILFEKQSRFFLNVLYVFILYKCSCWLFLFEFLFANDNAVYKGHTITPSLWKAAFVLYHSNSATMASIFIFSLIGLSLFGLFSRSTFLFLHLPIWFLLLNIHQATYISLSGGDYLLQQLVLCSLFLQKRRGERPKHPIIHNLSALAIMVQVCFMYVSAGVFKVINADWQNGLALFWFMKQDAFNTMQWQFPNFVSKVLNYLVVGYQLSFPILFFSKKLKPFLLFVGVIMHVFIIVIMGLWSFGIISLLPYLLFFERNSK